MFPRYSFCQSVVLLSPECRIPLLQWELPSQFRLVGARVVLFPGFGALVPDVCPRVPLLACSVAAVPWVEPPTAGTATSRGVGEATAVEGVVLERPGHHQSVAFGSTRVDLSPGAPGWCPAASLSGLLPPSPLSFSALLVLSSKRPSCLTIW